MIKRILNCIKLIWSFIKRVFFAFFGKARWLLIIILFCTVTTVLSLVNFSLMPYIRGVRVGGVQSDEFIFEGVDMFSVGDSGLAVITNCDNKDSLDSQDAVAVFDLNTGEENYANIANVTADIFTNDYFPPHNFAVAGDGTIYAVRNDKLDDMSLIYARDTVVRLSSDYRYLGEVCSFEYDKPMRQRSSKLSRLHYHDGAVTFSVTETDGVWLYSIDTADHAVTKSRCYEPEQDGTFTTLVIPIDDAFLFLQSDGNVRVTKFDEPLGDSIYRFDVNAESKSNAPYFDRAVLVNGKLYVTDPQDPRAVYLLENGEFSKAFDVRSDIVEIGSYRPAGASKDTLVICLDNGIFTYADGELADKTPDIRFHPNLLMRIELLLEYILNYAIYGLIIHLIIRKKNLLYKQLILIIPVFIAIAVFIVVRVYNYSDEQISERFDNEIAIICELGTTSFDGYDFSKLMEAGSGTGSAYREVSEKLEKISNDHGNNWSDNYVFSIVYRTDDNAALVIAGDDRVYMPLVVRIDAAFTGMSDSADGVYIREDLKTLFTDLNRTSRLSAFGEITDKEDSGRYYLMISSDTNSLFVERRTILFRVGLYSILVIAILTALIVISLLHNLRIIRKATRVVRDIADGDLSARINYRSKDELGEICSQVNEMGQNLETLFREKDETEQFYYKFVPERFRELLGKEKFTDLSLGDAKYSELTVLFCDIRSFSVNSEMMTAKESFAFVNVIYGKMGPIIRENNGFVDKYIGDAVMALFENADDAVKCGIELYRAIVHDPHTAEELKVSDINIGIGVHSGMAMVGIVGESERLSGTVISDTVNLSSRLESLTKQYQTAMLLSKDTLDRLTDPGSLNLRYLGIVQVAGVNEVKAVYEVLDCLSDDKRAERTANKEELHEAIRLFHLGRRIEAALALQKLYEAGMNDHVTDMYLEYIDGMSDDDKGNVFRFVRK